MAIGAAARDCRARSDFGPTSQFATSTCGSLFDQSTLIDKRQELELVSVGAEPPQLKTPPTKINTR
jgi:hypothetical protein